MKRLLWAGFFLVLVSVVGTLIFIRANPLVTPLPRNKSTPTTKQQIPNVLTQDHVFINSKYGYKLLYSDIFQITTPNPEVSDVVNFRKKTDEVPAHYGIDFLVIESRTGLRDACKTGDLENQGILCPRKNITYNPQLDGIPWEVYPKQLIGVVPSGYVYASTFLQGKIYIIINYGYEDIDAYVFTTNFSLTK